MPRSHHVAFWTADVDALAAGGPMPDGASPDRRRLQRSVVISPGGKRLGPAA
jgi:hypothetical protein